MSRCCNVPAAYLIPLRNNKVLLLKRKNTGFHDGEYSFIAGHVEDRESFGQAVIREAREESGLIITEADIKAAHIMHRNSDDAVRVDVFFTVSRWEGEAVNREPEKCAELSWFPLDDLPEKTIPFIRKTLERILKGEYYSEEGWQPV